MDYQFLAGARPSSWGGAAHFGEGKIKYPWFSVASWVHHVPDSVQRELVLPYGCLYRNLASGNLHDTDSGVHSSFSEIFVIRTINWALHYLGMKAEICHAEANTIEDCNLHCNNSQAPFSDFEICAFHAMNWALHFGMKAGICRTGADVSFGF